MTPKPKTFNFIGMDPGDSSGAIVVQWASGIIETCQLNRTTRAEQASFIRDASPRHAVGIHSRAILEHVQAMPMQGRSSTFKFGSSFGFLEGLLAAYRIPYGIVTPAKWQVKMKCRSKGDKNITKKAASRLYPDIKMTHGIADALLLMRCAELHWDELI